MAGRATIEEKMLVWCPACGRAFGSGALKPESGTALCEEHGEVRPHVGRPAVTASGERTTAPTKRWSTAWSQKDGSYAYEARIHTAMSAYLARYPWQEGAWAAGADPLAFVLAVPLFALTYVPLLLSPRIRIDASRVRFGLRSLRLKHVGAFAVTKHGKGGSQLIEVQQDVALLECTRAEDVLAPLRDELNEALFVVRRQAPLLAPASPYRG